MSIHRNKMFGVIFMLILFWFFTKEEVFQEICINLLFLIIIILIVWVIVAAIKQEKLKHIIVLIVFDLIFLVHASFAHDKVVAQVDLYALKFSEKYKCRMDISDLLKNNTGWKSKNPTSAVKYFNKWGAARKIIYVTYQEDGGILKYGYLYDDKKQILLKKCTEQNNKVVQD